MTAGEKMPVKAALGEMCEDLAEQAKNDLGFLQYYNRLLRFEKDTKRDIEDD